MKMLAMYLLSAQAALFAVNADIISKPRDTESVVGDTTYFDCASNVNGNEVNWYFFATGAKRHEDICLYCLRKIHPLYRNRIQVEKNISTGNSRLRITSVRLEDAGRYVCQDNGGIGDSTSAQLVVLESNPICTSNIKPDGLLGPNSCNIEQDKLHLSCSVLYNGNIPPMIQWREIGTADPVNKGLFCWNSGNRITCNLMMNTDLDLNGASYICETNKSATTQYSCNSDIIRIIYAKTDTSTKETTIHGSGEKFNCSANSSQTCSYTWKWFDGVVEEVLSNDSVLTPWKIGWHKCEANCDIRGKQCTLLSKLLYVSETKNFLTQYWFIANSLTFTVNCLFLICFITVCCCLGLHSISKKKRTLFTVCCCLGLHSISKKKRTLFTGCNRSMQQFMPSNKQPILTENSKTNNNCNQLEIIKPNSTGAHEKEIYGLAILEENICCQENIYCKTVEVYDVMALILKLE